jgi:transcriptional regulator with XRE-family HTH domain
MVPRWPDFSELGFMKNISGREFGELLREYRLRAGLTQQELADLATLSVRALRDLEAGHVTRPRRKTVQLLTAALGRGDEQALIGQPSPRLALVVDPDDHPGVSRQPDDATPVVHVTLAVVRSEWQRLLSVLVSDGVVTVTIGVALADEKSRGGSVSA